MGSIIYAECECGYKKDRMLIGGGMANFNRRCNFPYYCDNCNTIIVHNAFIEPAYCTCGNLLVRYDNEDLSTKNPETKICFNWSANNQKLILTHNKYLCPECKKYGLEWSLNGCWD